jgi:hypothetical protein
VLQNWVLIPSPGISDVVVEYYNAALGLQDLVEYSSQVFCFDNAALTGICKKQLDLDSPRFEQMNNIVALTMSGVTVR